MNQVKDQFTSQELAIISSVICQNSGGTLENTSFLEILRWWVAGGSSVKSLFAYVIKYKLGCGQSGLARKIFEEAQQTGKLSYSFKTIVQKIEQSTSGANVTTKDNKHYSARKVICTIPLNVLKDIEFQPPLTRLKKEAISKGHVDQMIKIHAEVKGNEWRSWSGTAWPGKGLAGAYGDGLTKAGNTHLVAFGNNAQIDPPREPERLVEAFRHLEPSLPLERLVSIDTHQYVSAEALWLTRVYRYSMTGTTTPTRKVRGVSIRPALPRSTSTLFSNRTGILNFAGRTGRMEHGEASSMARSNKHFD